MSKAPALTLPPEALQAAVANAGGETWLKAEQVSAITGFSLKWLATAREGNSPIPGPPYRKMGDARTSPVRYPLSALAAWQQQFALVLNTSGAEPAMHRSYFDFMSAAPESGVRKKSRWLFAVSDETGALADFVSAVRQQRITEKTRLVWLTRAQLQGGRVFRVRRQLTAAELHRLLGTGQR